VKANSIFNSKLAAWFFIFAASAFCAIANFFPEKLGDLVVAFFGASVGVFFGITYALHIYQKQVNDSKEAEERVNHQTKLAKKRTLQQRRIDHIRWLSGILKQVINYANNQADEMNLLAEEMQKEPSEVHQLGIIANSSIERLTRADNEATFHAYNTISPEDPERDKHYGELLGITDFLAAQISQVLKGFQGYLKNMYERQLRIKAMLEQAANDLATLKSSMDFGGQQAHATGSPFHNDVNRLLLDYTSLIVRSRPMREIVTDFVNPLLKVLVAKPHFPGSNELTMKLKDINIAFTDLKRESEHSIESFKPEKLKEPASRLSVVRDGLENGIKSSEASLDLLV